MTCSQEHPAQKHPEQPCANTQVLLRSLLSQRRGLLSLRILPSVPSSDPNHAQAMWWQDSYWEPLGKEAAVAVW